MKIDVLGVRINSETKVGLLRQLGNALNSTQSIFIVTPYSEMIVRAQKDEQFRQILNSADFVLPDGIGILWAANYLKRLKIRDFRFKYFGRCRLLIRTLLSIIFNPKSIYDPIPEKISGSDFIWDLSRLAADRGYSVFLLGGYGDTADRAAQALVSKYRNLKIAGTSNAPSSESLIKKINQSGAHFLFVALGPGRQEQWIHDNLPNLHVKLAIGLGGTFDYLAGKRPPAPQIWAKMGLEWLWRLLTQPWRVGRILRGILGLIWYAFKHKITS